MSSHQPKFSCSPQSSSRTRCEHIHFFPTPNAMTTAKMHTLIATVISLLLRLSTTASAARNPKPAANSALLSQIKTLTLHSDRQTSHRRVPALPQLTCVGGNAANLYTIDTMRCKNAGSEYDAEDVQWTCQASLPPEFKLGGTEVICEGFDSPEDPWVLKGSCGVEYRLVLTELGEEKFGGGGSGFGKGPGGSDVVGALWGLVFWGVFICMSAACICARILLLTVLIQR